MTATISTNPYATTNAAGSFNVTSIGYIQGTALDSPSVRNQLSGGVLANSETIPMWGGVGISEAIGGAVTSYPNTDPMGVLGGIITRATNVTGVGVSGDLTGWSVFDQNYAAVNTPSSPVPLIPSYGQVNFYRIGSGARIAVACSPNIVNLQGSIINSKVSWDFVNQQLEPYSSTTLSSLTSYTSGTGIVIVVTAGNHGLLPGDTFEISGVTGSGTNLALLNGEQTAVAGTTGTTLAFAIATGQTVTTVTGGTVSSGGALNVEVLDVQIGNSMTVVYTSGTNTATWNRSGNCAIILI